MDRSPCYNTCRWRRLSRHIRFGRALGYCEMCGVPHGAITADGCSLILLDCAHLNGNIHDLRPENLAAFCPKCHFLYDELRRVEALARKHPEIREFLAGKTANGEPQRTQRKTGDCGSNGARQRR